VDHATAHVAEVYVELAETRVAISIRRQQMAGLAISGNPRSARVLAPLLCKPGG